MLVLAVCLAQAAAAVELRPWAGGPTPALELADLDGRRHRLADYRGKVLLVNFWATWCEPCRDEMPSIDRLRRSMADEPFEVLAVNLAEPRSRIERFLASVPLGFPVLLDTDTRTAKAWQAMVLPASYLLDRSGLIRYVHYGELDWFEPHARAKVHELLSGGTQAAAAGLPAPRGTDHDGLRRAPAGGRKTGPPPRGP